MTVAQKKAIRVYLDAGQQAILADLAARLGLSKAEVLRRGLDRLAREVVPPEEDPALELIGLMGEDTDSPGDLSVEHDRYLVEWSSNA